MPWEPFDGSPATDNGDPETSDGCASKNVLDAAPDAYSDDLYDKKCGQVFEHIYESYRGDGHSKSAAA